MAVRDVAEGLVERCKRGDFMGAIDQYYDDGIVSVESVASAEYPAEVRGLDEVRAKNERWSESNEVHAVEVQGPYVGDDGFTVRYTFDVTNKPSGQRVQFTEMALYQVRDDRIVREQFFYNAPGQ